MKFIAGETVTITVAHATLTVKIEDASKGDVISAKVEAAKTPSDHYTVGQVYEFNRAEIITAA